MAKHVRNAERSRQRLLSAALAEFAAKGFAGARVDDIARRAGLNKQMMFHYFGDKEGIYTEVTRLHRDERVSGFSGDTATMPGELAATFTRTWSDLPWVRTIQWQNLEAAGDQIPADDPRHERYAERIAWVEREQRAGRLPADLDPDLLLLSLIGLTIYPLLLPIICEIVTGLDPASDEFAERYARHLDQLATVFASAAESPQAARARSRRPAAGSA